MTGNIVQFGSIITEHELLSRTIPNLFTSVRTPQIASSVSPAPAWDRTRVPPAPRRGAPNLTLGSHSIPRNEWCVGNTSTSLRDWHTPYTPPAAHVSFARVLRRVSKIASSSLGELPPRGLQNVSNDCFANSVLQLLVHCAPLRDWVERVDVAVTDLEGLKGASVAAPTLVRVFVQLVHDYRYGVGQDDTLVSPWSPFAKPLPPLKLASRLVPTVMPGRKTVLEQQDAQEFLFLLLDSLHAALLDASTNEQDDPARGVYYLSDSEDEGSGSISSNGSGGGSSSSSSGSGGGNAAGKNGAHEQWTEIGPASRKSVVITTEGAWRDSAISHLLRGRMRSTLKRRANSSVSIEPFFALSLEPLAGSAVGAALPEKRRHGVQAPTCTLMQLLKAYLEPERVTTVSNNAAVAREKQTSLEQLPPVLLIHIARFAFVGGVTRKLDTHVEFGAQLEVPIDLFAVHAAPASAPQYRLRGVVRHHGASASSGHYTACVLVQKPATKKEPASDEWYLFDDMNVSTTSESAVLDSTDSAYLLLYSRV